ncbi:capsular polysaccharide biosynthesis protein [Phytobacter massiliensis]|uniref:capsular polysaccharide biosynthesis protein n=1 Tax=Phytobacter massiliensis TaxID=1485952 RepID=UPI00030FE29A|nr:capsular polysaccharide biosynthesis protein [Phytobacter massiliensis]
MNRKIKKLLSNPSLFFRDAIANYKQKNNPQNDGVIFAFHINDWKRPILQSWFNDKKFCFVPFNFKNNKIKNDWLRRIKNTKNAEFFIWGMNLPEPFASLEVKKTFIEDGFIRSVGLGASHTPPLSLNFDSRTLYFNARKESDLEYLLNTYNFDEDLLDRARNLKKKLIEAGISKYNNSARSDITEIYGPKEKKRILVIGQVEDDASIEYGSITKYSNNDIVMIAHMENPDAQIIYKPHPDVLNGFRKHQSNPKDVRHLCQIITQDIPLSQALESIDHVYTISSLAGFEALIRDIKVTTLGCPFYSGWGLTDDRQENSRRNRVLTIDELFAASYILYPKYFDPIYRKYITPEQALDVLIRQREIVQKVPVEVSDSLEPTVTTVFGFHINDWKRPIIETWFPDKKFIYVPFNFKDKATIERWIKKINSQKNAELLIWGMRLPQAFKSIDIKKTYVEDGFLRSVGLGAAHTPPLSLNFDSKTLYFNAREESDLESLLNTFDFDEKLLERGRNFKEKLIKSGISKYNNSNPIDINAIYGLKSGKRILVVGQVEDDASIEYGSLIKYTNNELVTIARLENPDAQIFYKPHPDVLNGFRKFQSDPKDVQNICQVITEDLPLSQALETIDHVYTISSLAGFEALIRNIKVTTMGCPFYSGWGLTDDRQLNPRRTRTLTIDELFTAAYILYPKYLNPLTRKYITPEEALDYLIKMKHLTSLNKSDEKEDEKVEDADIKLDDILIIKNELQSVKKALDLVSKKIDTQLINTVKKIHESS